VNQQIDTPSPTARQWLEAKTSRLQMMLEVSRVLNSTLDLDTLLRMIIEVATQVTQTEAASILLLDEETGELHFEAATGVKRAEVKRTVVPLEGSIAGWIITHKQPLMVNNVHHDPRHYVQVDRATQFDTRSILGAPLHVKDQTIGVLEVLNKRDKSSFTEQDIETLETLAAQAAVAIANARLFAQSDQLADVIHELRTPMTSIVGYTQILLKNEDLPPSTQKTYLETINREAVHLGKMVNDFLDLVRLESGRARLEREPVNMEHLAREVVMSLLPQANDGDISIHLHADAHLPSVPGDEERLKQVLMNLVSNAIKYNREGGRIDVSLNLFGDSLCTTVVDTGRGISAENLPRVFDKFYQEEGDETTVKGAGLGLSIARQIVEAHGGSIWAESKPGVGSNFSFTLPLR
jgi:signal transduction histidine kinase